MDETGFTTGEFLGRPFPAAARQKNATQSLHQADSRHWAYFRECLLLGDEPLLRGGHHSERSFHLSANLL